MATVDVRNGGTEFSDEIVLKIWRWEEQSGSTKGWVLNSRVDRPHDKTAVTTLAFCPKVLSNEEGYLLLTAGDNGQTRLWRSHRSGDDGQYFLESYALICTAGSTNPKLDSLSFS